MKTQKRRLALRRYVVPLSLVCCLLFFIGISLAKMLSNDPIVRNTDIHVAGWDVDVYSLDGDSMTLDAGSNSQSYSLTVTNNSEVASTYGIKVSNIPAGIKIGLDATSDDDLVTPVDGEAVFTNTGGDLGYDTSNNTRTHTLTLAAIAEADITQSEVDMAIEVLFTQKEPQL